MPPPHLAAFSAQFHRAINELQIMATTAEINELFDRMDINDSGSITMDEMGAHSERLP